MCSLWIVYYKDKFIIAINFKKMGKRVKNQNHTCTIHRNTTNSFIPLGSNIQFSTNTEKEHVIIKKNL
jgi:uncharacterized pyridoxamine 5'-phosphate oxidase family protein